MKTTLVVCSVAVAGALVTLLGCATSAQPAPSGEGADPSASAPAASAAGAAATAPEEKHVIGDPRTGGAVFEGAITLPSPLKEVSR